MNIHPNSEPRSVHTKDSDVPNGGRGQVKIMVTSDQQQTPKSTFRASDINLMTERGEEEHERSPQHETPHSIFMPKRHPDRNYLHADPVLGALVNLQRPAGAEGALTDPQVSDYSASGKHSRQPSGAEGERIPLRIKSGQNTQSKATRMQTGKGPQTQQFAEQVRIKAPECRQDFVEQRPSMTRNALSLDPLVRSNPTGEQDMTASATEINRTSQFGRPLGPSVSQPPQTGFQPVISSRERLNLINASAWRSPVRTTASGNIGLLSSHLKLNRQLLSGTHQRSYRDYHRDLLQQRSVRLEDELIQTQTTLRQKEGSLKIKIALLEQQAAQMKQEISEAKRREEAQKSTYDQILQIIHRQLLDANLSEPSYNAILINLNYVQHLLNGANKNFAVAAVSQSLKPKLDDCQAPPRLDEKADAATKSQTKQLQDQLQDQSITLKKYEQQNKEFIEQMSQLQLQIGSQRETISFLEGQNRDLSEKLQKVEGDLKDQREREQKLKTLHNDEMKFNEEMNTYEQQLFQSKIKELESNLASMHNRMQIWNMTEVNVEGASQGSQIGATDDPKSPRRPMFNHSVRLESLQNCLRKHRSNSNSHARGVRRPDSCSQTQTPLKVPYIGAAGSVVAAQSTLGCDRDCQTEESVFQDSIQKLIKGLRAEYDAGKRQKDEENGEIREKLNYMQSEREIERQEWQKKADEQDETITRLRGEIEAQQTSKNEATTQLEKQLHEAQRTCRQKEEDNQALRSQISLVRTQIEKLEKIQRGENSLSKSKRGSPLAKQTDSKVDEVTGRLNRSPLSAKRRSQRQTVQLNVSNIGNSGYNGAHTMQQQLFGLKKQVQSTVYDQDIKVEVHALQARSPTHAVQGCHRVLQIDLSGDIRHFGNSNDKAMGQRSKSSRGLTGLGKIRLNDFEEQRQNPSTSRQKGLHAQSKKSLKTDHGKSGGTGKAASRATNQNEIQQVPWKIGTRPTSPGDCSLKKVHSTRAVLKTTSNQKSRGGLQKGQVVAINLPVKDLSRDGEASQPSPQPRVRKHDCLNGSRKNSNQGAEEADPNKRGAKCTESVSIGQRQLKPSLKSRSSSRVSAVKNELAKQLQALRASQQSPTKDCLQGMPSSIPKGVITDYTKQDNAIADSIPPQEAPYSQADALRHSKISNQSFNLQTINQHMQGKGKEAAAKGGSGIQSGRQTASLEGLLKLNADPEKSGESGDWGPSPGGIGSSVVKNRRKMDKYSFQQNHRLQSMNTNNRIKPIGTYGKMKNSRYDTYSDNSKCQMYDGEDQQSYFGDVSQKKLITNLSQKGVSQGPGRAGAKKSEGNQNPQGDLQRWPAIVERVQVEQTRQEHHQKQYSSTGYSTQPAGGPKIKKAIRTALALQGSNSVMSKPHQRNKDIQELIDSPSNCANDTHQQYDSFRPEVQIALSEDGDQGDAGQTGDISSQISPVKQEAPKASIQDMAKGSPALESRRLHDHYQFANVDTHCRSKSQHSRKLGLGSRPLSKLMQPVQTQSCKPDQLERQQQHLDQPSSMDSDTSIGSELLNEDGEETMPIENQALPTFQQHSHSNNLQQLRTMVQPSMTSYVSNPRPSSPMNLNPGLQSYQQSCSSQQYPNSPGSQPVFVPPDFLGKLDELFGRIHQRDMKVNKLKTRNKGLKQKLEQLEALYVEVCQKLEASERQKEEVELQLQKFECRLKQAQIVLNDQTDRVDLQLNRPSVVKPHYEENPDIQRIVDAKSPDRQLAYQQPERQELLKVQSHIQDLQRKKSQIRQAERSRQRSLQKNLVSQPESCSRNSDHPGDILSTHMSQLRVPAMPKSPHQSTQQLPGWSGPQTGMSFLSKRANSISSTPNLYQFKRQFQSMSKLNKKSAVQNKQRAVPLIDLSGLEENKSGEQTGNRQPLAREVAHRAQPVGYRSPFKEISGCITQRPALKASPLPPSTPLSALIHGRSQSKQQRQQDFTVQVQAANYFSNASQQRLQMRDFDESSVEAPGMRSCAAIKSDFKDSQVLDQRIQKNAGSLRPELGQAKTSRGFESSRDANRHGKQFGTGSRLGMHKRNGSRTCNGLVAEEWKQRNQIMSSAVAHTGAQNPQHGHPGRATEGAGVFKHLELQDNKSVASTQPSKTIFGGADSSKRSMGTGDSKSSLPFMYLKKQLKPTPNGSSVAQNLLHKSSESALSAVPHRQKAPKKIPQAANLATLGDGATRGPQSQQNSSGTARTTRPHLTSRLAMTLSAADVGGVSTSNTYHRRGGQANAKQQHRAAFR